MLAAALLQAPGLARAQALPADTPGAAQGALTGSAPTDADSSLIIVAVADRPEAVPGVGSTPRADYRRLRSYAGSSRARALAEELARDHALQAQDAWTIVPLGLRCVLFRIAPGASRARVLAALAGDPRVALAQPLNVFETLQSRPAEAAGIAAPAAGLPYNDPYVGLQRGFVALGAPAAQRHSQGQGVRVAVIDTGIDAAHPDLQGRVALQRDFAAAHPMAGTAERHGTAVAGVIAAGANNGIGIVGMAPQAQLLGLRACWPVGGVAGAAGAAAAAGAARCDSFTLAQALGAAITADADVINLSLGGPADPLLALLATRAMAGGAIVVGALPPAGRRAGFPSGVPGVLVVASSDDAPDGPSAQHTLSAPGRDILSLVPGGNYDFASGSSLAAAQVSGVVALLRSLRRDLNGEQAQRWLAPGGRGAVDACAAVGWSLGPAAASKHAGLPCVAAGRPQP